MIGGAVYNSEDRMTGVHCCRAGFGLRRHPKVRRRQVALGHELYL